MDAALQQMLENERYRGWILRGAAHLSAPFFTYGGETLVVSPTALSGSGGPSHRETSRGVIADDGETYTRAELAAGILTALNGELLLDESLLDARLFDAFERLYPPARQVPLSDPAEIATIRGRRDSAEPPKPRKSTAHQQRADVDEGREKKSKSRDAVSVEPTKTRVNTPLVSKRIVQVSGVVGPMSSESVRNLEFARATTLDWLAGKGVVVPEGAYRGETFEQDITQTQHPIIVDATSGCWAMQFDTTDGRVGGRTWRTEVVFYRQDTRILLGLVLTVIDPKGTDGIRHTSIPQLILRLTKKVGLFDDGRLLDDNAMPVESPADVDRLVDLLESPTRSRAVVVVARNDVGDRLIDASYLAKRLAGVAHVADVDSESSWELTRRYGKPLSVYGLAVRVYRAGFDPDIDTPNAHPSFVGERWLEAASVLRDRLIELAAEQTTKEGQDAVPSFALVRRWIAESRIQEARRTASTRNEQIVLLERENQQLKADVQAAEELAQDATRERDAARAREQDHQERARVLGVRAAWLEQRLRDMEARGDSGASTDIPYPDTWDDLEEWAEQWLGGRLVVLRAAVREARKSLFKDIPLAYRALHLLGDYYQPMCALGTQDARERFSDLRDSLRLDVSAVGDACRNHRTKERYKATWKGERITLDMHVSGSSSRRKEEGFRMYFYYDGNDDVVVVGHFPTHLPNTLS